MNENDIAYKLAIESAKKALKKKVTKEEALQDLVSAGILDKDGDFTGPYQDLTKYFKYTSR